jgi:enoyl-[acyl-carrier-protein] reductase (NADH)
MSDLLRHFWPMVAARLITGSTLYVDGGYHIID